MDNHLIGIHHLGIVVDDLKSSSNTFINSLKNKYVQNKNVEFIQFSFFWPGVPLG